MCSLGSHVPRGFFAPQPGEDLTTSLTWDILYGDGVVIAENQNGKTTNYTYGIERISVKTGSTRTEYRVWDRVGQGTVPCSAVLSLSAINGTWNRPLSHISCAAVLIGR